MSGKKARASTHSSSSSITVTPASRSVPGLSSSSALASRAGPSSASSVGNKKQQPAPRHAWNKHPSDDGPYDEDPYDDDDGNYPENDALEDEYFDARDYPSTGTEASSDTHARMDPSPDFDALPEPESDNACSICLDELFEEAKGSLPACSHTFCLRCILRWSLVRSRCPLCKLEFTHVNSHFNLDGSFEDTLKSNLACLLVKARWLDLTEQTGEVVGGRSVASRFAYADQHVLYEDDAFGDSYGYDAYDDEYDPSNYAPGKGKSGRDAKIASGGYSICGREWRSAGPIVPKVEKKGTKKKKNAAFSTNER